MYYLSALRIDDARYSQVDLLAYMKHAAIRQPLHQYIIWQTRLQATVQELSKMPAHFSIDRIVPSMLMPHLLEQTFKIALKFDINEHLRLQLGSSIATASAPSSKDDFDLQVDLFYHLDQEGPSSILSVIQQIVDHVEQIHSNTLLEKKFLKNQTNNIQGKEEEKNISNPLDQMKALSTKKCVMDDLSLLIQKFSVDLPPLRGYHCNNVSRISTELLYKEEQPRLGKPHWTCQRIT